MDEVLVQAQTDFAAAAALEGKRLRLDILVPGLNEQIESRFPFDASMLIETTLRLAAAIAPLRTTVLLDSPGTAAMAQAFYEREFGGELCPHVTLSALSRHRYALMCLCLCVCVCVCVRACVRACLYVCMYPVAGHGRIAERREALDTYL